MTERVDIANLALNWIGEEQITSLEDDTKAARTMRLNYRAARDATLEAHEWSFAIVRFEPARLEEPPLFKWRYAYQVPADVMRVLSCERAEDAYGPDSIRWEPTNRADEQIDWAMERNCILTNEGRVFARGIERVTEEGRYSNLFVHALAAKLAAVSSVALTASSSVQASMYALYSQMIKEAKSRDGLQGRNLRIRNRSLLKSR